MAESTSASPPLYRILAVYEGSCYSEDITWLTEWCQDSGHDADYLEPFPIGLPVRRLEDPDMLPKLCQDKGNELANHIRTNVDTGANLIIVALGFASLVTMSALQSDPNLIPMGLVLASVHNNSATGKSSAFKRWHRFMTDQVTAAIKYERDMEFTEEELRLKTGDPEMSYQSERNPKGGKHEDQIHPTVQFLKSMLVEFNIHCRSNRIRFSYVCRHKETDFISKQLRYGRVYRENDTLSTMSNILDDHIRRSWPERLLLLIRSDQDDDADFTIDDHRGEHCHEPLIAAVLREAASKGKIKLVKKLLDDGVHPDVCVKKGDETAYEVASSSAIRQLLYKYGAKVHEPPPWCPWTDWYGMTSNANESLPKPNSSAPDGPTSNGMRGEDFRALVVDIYNPASTKACMKVVEGQQDTSEKNVSGLRDPKTTVNSKFDLPGHEYYRIAHPTVADLVYHKGPDEIMGETPKEFDSCAFDHYRWIHLPMNHMTWLRDLAKMICNQRCSKTHKAEGNGAHAGAKLQRRNSGQDCAESCIPKLDQDSQSRKHFPSLPGCADSIFEARYWLGQQDTPGTEDYATIRNLRPMFQRLGLVQLNRTGFSVAVPFVHFDTFDNVQKMKDTVANLQDQARKLILPTGCRLDNEAKICPALSKSSTSTGYFDDKSNIPSSTIEVIEKDLFSTLPVHCRRTLSQYSFFAKLQKAKQVITRHFEEKWPSEDPLTLMVDQLWMLVLVDGTIVTCFPSQMGGVQREFPYIYTDIVEELLGDLRNRWRPPMTSQLDLAFMIIKGCIGFIFNQRARYNKRFRFLNIYEQQLSDIAADEVRCFNYLMKIIEKLPDPGDKGYETQARCFLQDLLRLGKDFRIMENLERLKHIRREVNILLDVVKEQEKVIKQMTDELESGEFQGIFSHGAELRAKRAKRAQKLQQRQQVLLALDQKADNIFKDLELSLLRKEQQVQNIEAYFASQLNSRSFSAGTIVLIFTLITTVFTPLSFLTSFFTLNVIEFPHDDDGISMSLSYVTTWIFGIGSIIIVVILAPMMFLLLDARSGINQWFEARKKPQWTPPLQSNGPQTSNYGRSTGVSLSERFGLKSQRAMDEEMARKK